jgi:hypothetical protein
VTFNFVIFFPADKADKAAIGEEVATLLFLKSTFKEKSGAEWVPLEKRGKKEEKKKDNKENQQPKPEG